MEKLSCNRETKELIANYLEEGCLSLAERRILQEIAGAENANDQKSLDWFQQMGTSLRNIVMNVNSYRSAAEFGFSEIALDSSGWLERPNFQKQEIIKLGNTKLPNEYSTINIGKGINDVWSYGFSINYGCAGHSSPLSVHGAKHVSRQAALAEALNYIKAEMKNLLGNPDTTNFKQHVISSTLVAISQAQVSAVQTTLF